MFKRLLLICAVLACCSVPSSAEADCGCRCLRQGRFNGCYRPYPHAFYGVGYGYRPLYGGYGRISVGPMFWGRATFRPQPLFGF